jgi:presenilin-like A22 family membrane protease
MSRDSSSRPPIVKTHASVPHDVTNEASAESPETAKPAADTYPIGMREIGAVAAMLLMFVAAQVLSLLLLRPFASAGVQGFEDPEDPLNAVWLIGIILVFTAVILWIARKKRERVIQWIILGSVGLTLVYVIFPLLLQIPGLENFGTADTRYLGAILVAIPPAVVLTILLYRFPEWYIVDVVGVLVAAGSIAIFGSSFTPSIYVFVLVGLAVYDYISVYKTKHMLSLADSVLNYHLPIMLVVPKHLDYSFLDESTTLRKDADEPIVTPAATAASMAPAPAATATKKKPRDAMFLGLGDVVIPSIFALTALQVSALSAATAMMGVIAGFLFLMTFVLRGKPQAGLPALNGGAFLGFLIGLYIDTGSLVFW